MAGPRLYGQMLVSIQGVLSQEASSVEYSNENKDQRVETLALGYDGVTPSPDVTIIKVEGFMPAAGMEIDLQKLEQTRTFVTIGVVQIGNGKKASSVGTIKNVHLKSGVGQNSTWSFDFEGTPSKFN